MDLRPDWIPVLGWIDDIILLAIGIYSVRRALDSYKLSFLNKASASKDTDDKQIIDGEYRIID